MLKNLLSKLRQKSYRDAYVKAQISQGLAYQIAALRQQRGWSQQDLAKNLSLKSPSSIARMEDPSYAKLSIGTLLKLASAFDVALSIRFQPYSRFVKERQDTSATALYAKAFDQEDHADAWLRQLDRLSVSGWPLEAANHPYLSAAAPVIIHSRSALDADMAALAS